MKKQTIIKNEKDNFRQIMDMLLKIHDKLERMNKAKEALDGDELLDNQERHTPPYPSVPQASSTMPVLLPARADRLAQHWLRRLLWDTHRA